MFYLRGAWAVPPKLEPLTTDELAVLSALPGRRYYLRQVTGIVSKPRFDELLTALRRKRGVYMDESHIWRVPKLGEVEN